ncbi:MAG: ATP-binding protein [Desulfobulbus sp.]|nr:ATP-binding protein [Desulfobulbus sp.]
MPWKKHSIAYRLTFQVILFSSMIACLATALQLYLDYRRDIDRIYTFFNVIEESSLRPLEESVWTLDELQVNLQLEGLIKREDIVQAAVKMDGQTVWSRGEPSDTSITHVYPLRHKVQNHIEEIGQLQVTASFAGIYQRLTQRIIVLLVSNAVKTFLVSGFILFLFQNALTRHLTRLASYAGNIDLKRGQLVPLQLDRPASTHPDEFDQVVEALNFLCASGRKALTDLVTQEERLRLFLDATEEVVLGVDTEDRCIFINRAGLEHFAETDATRIIGKDILALLAVGRPETARPLALSELIRTTIVESRGMFADEMPLCLPDGSSLLVTLRSYPVIENAQCTGAAIFYTDTSHQQQLEQEKLLFAKVIRQTTALILIGNAENIVEYVNASFEQMIGRDGDELKGQSLLDCLFGPNLADQIAQVQASIEQGEPWTGSFTRPTPQGRAITLSGTVFPVLNRDGRRTHVVGMVRDITREQQLVEQLHHAQKMEAVGKLAGSIAHEFGNPLLGIRFVLRDVQQRLRQDAKSSTLLQLAESECDRMRKLIRDLQQFNRPSTGIKTVFDIHRLLEDILTLYRNFLNERKITLVGCYDHHTLCISAVEDQIRQVFINLIINAADAVVQHGGRLTLKTAREDEWIVVCVEDDGPGIAPEHLGRIFEPYFTTKAVEGSGLGLPVSYGIVQAHGGSIKVQSEPGHTVFRVSLLAADEESA